MNERGMRSLVAGSELRWNMGRPPIKTKNYEAPQKGTENNFIGPNYKNFQPMFDINRNEDYKVDSRKGEN